jgi:hypothetical protein
LEKLQAAGWMLAAVTDLRGVPGSGGEQEKTLRSRRLEVAASEMFAEWEAYAAYRTQRGQHKATELSKLLSITKVVC